MKGFLEQTAESLYNKYGDEISSLVVLFPSRRARLFFNEALSRIAGKPIWQPRYTTIDDLMGELSGIGAGDHIRMMTELYSVYSEYHQETFDSFYFWGEMLLSDFDSIDKYMIDADMLFSNISDLKEISDDFSYLTPEQAEIIARFWRSFGHETEYSAEKQRFVEIWRTLSPIYHKFKTRLTGMGLGYTGMIYRDVAEKIKQGELAGSAKSRRYVIAGFNALSETEKILFDHLQRHHDVEFLWDYDRYYLDNEEQEAGLFLRENIRRFPQKTPMRYACDSFSSPKNITVTESPSDTMQCKFAGELVARLGQEGGFVPDKETAIVLTDENLLMPLLYSIPEGIDKINVTMGYPLKLTPAYSFLERLIQLQLRKRRNKKGMSFYHNDAVGLLRHPYVAAATEGASTGLADMLVERQHIYIESSRLRESGLLEVVFSDPATGWDNMSGYLQQIVGEITATLASKVDENENNKQQVEFLSLLSDNIARLRNSLVGCGIELSDRIYASLLRKILQNVRVPFDGEPLEGVQVMGILETRNLDFRNVVLLSVTDDTFPGNRSASSSFIPYNLRLAYGLPTPQHHEGVYAYYFYRLLQRAENIHLVYSSRADDKSSGEQSRYIYQLQYESPHEIRRQAIGLDVNLTPPEPIEVDKKGDVAEKLKAFLCELNPDGEAVAALSLSPTSFYNYVACPLKFYFYSIARLRVEDEVSEEIDAPMFGTILHGAMERLYRPALGVAAPRDYIRSLIDSDKIAEAVDEAIVAEYFHGDEVAQDEYSGNLMLVRDIVCKYINNCILPFDASRDGFRIEMLEKKITGTCGFELDGVVREVSFGGLADRIDRLDSGRCRVVDYKTGLDHLEFNGLDALFSGVHSEMNAAALQTLLYSMMLSRQPGMADTQPALYYVRKMNNADYSPLLEDKSAGRPVESYSDYKAGFESLLSAKLAELFDPATPFTQCEDTKQCAWCDFNVICRR